MASSYTDLNRQRTRVVARGETAEPQGAGEDPIGYTQLMSMEKPRLFEGISLAQVIAGAAAAATSMVLASHIGIGGSVIGAAVSSVVTVVSSQLYRHFLDASAAKIRRGGAAVRDAAAGAGGVHGAYRGGAEATTVIGAGRPDAATTTVAHGGAARRGARVAPAKLQARAAAERAATQRKVVAFSAVIAIAAVVACVLAITLGTGGEGIGVKTDPIFAPPRTETEAAGDAVPGTGLTGGDDATGGDVSVGAPSDGTGTGATTSDGTGAGAADSSTGSTGTATPGTGTTSTDATGGSSSTGTGSGTSSTTGDGGGSATGDSTGTSSDGSSSSDSSNAAGGASGAAGTGTASATSQG